MPYVSPQGMILDDSVSCNAIKIDTMKIKSYGFCKLVDDDGYFSKFNGMLWM